MAVRSRLADNGTFCLETEDRAPLFSRWRSGVNTITAQTTTAQTTTAQTTTAQKIATPTTRRPLCAISHNHVESHRIRRNSDKQMESVCIGTTAAARNENHTSTPLLDFIHTESATLPDLDLKPDSRKDPLLGILQRSFTFSTPVLENVSPHPSPFINTISDFFTSLRTRLSLSDTTKLEPAPLSAAGQTGGGSAWWEKLFGHSLRESNHPAFPTAPPDSGYQQSREGHTQPFGVRWNKQSANFFNTITSYFRPVDTSSESSSSEVETPLLDSTDRGNSSSYPMTEQMAAALQAVISEAVSRDPSLLEATYALAATQDDSSNRPVANLLQQLTLSEMFESANFRNLPDNVKQIILANAHYIADRIEGIQAALREGDTQRLRELLADLIHLGGPEVSGVWASVKVGLGIATLVGGHALLGSLFVAWGAGAVGGAVLWGSNRGLVRNWIVGESPTAGQGEDGLTDSGNETRAFSPTWSSPMLINRSLSENSFFLPSRRQVVRNLQRPSLSQSGPRSGRLTTLLQ